MEENVSRFLVESDWLERQLGDENLVIVDCHYHLEIKAVGDVKLTSGKASWEEGHIPGSVFVDLLAEVSDKEIPLPFMMPPIRQFAEVMSANGIGDRSRVVIYDRAESTWAARLWWMLRFAGFDNAVILNGGWQKWTAEKRPQSTDSAKPQPAEFVARPRPELFVDKGTVLESINDRSIVRICALGGEIFRKGHIPCSVNIPAAGLVDPEKKTFLPTERLEQIFCEAGVSREDRIICYCGGSISACCDAFVLAMLGFSDVRVYDGSMEEWALDSTLPVES